MPLESEPGRGYRIAASLPEILEAAAPSADLVRIAHDQLSARVVHVETHGEVGAVCHGKAFREVVQVFGHAAHLHRVPVEDIELEQPWALAFEVAAVVHRDAHDRLAARREESLQAIDGISRLEPHVAQIGIEDEQLSLRAFDQISEGKSIVGQRIERARDRSRLHNEINGIE